MKRTLLALALLAAGGWAASLLASRPAPEPSFEPPTGLPQSALELVEALPFVVDQPFVHEWCADKPLVSAGVLVVLAVDPDLARPRQTWEAVLFAGNQTVERCNAPENGRYLVGLVPASADAEGRVALDLEHTPIWFGSLELPERVDAAAIAHERALAEARGIGPARRAANARLRASASETLHVRTREDLSPYLADWIEHYSPEEADLVAQLRRVGTGAR